MLGTLEAQIMSLVHVLPLSWFAFFASFIEEVIVPIPSPFVMLTAGSFAKLQGMPIPEIMMLAVIGALGKTCGALCVYWIADKAEDFLLGRHARFFGVTHSEVEKFGRKFSGTPRDYALMILFRSLPIIPSALVSIGGGLLKLPLRLFITGTLVGTLVRDGVYLYIGYVGTEALHRMASTSKTIEDMVLAVVLTGVGVAFSLWYVRKKRRASLNN